MRAAAASAVALAIGLAFSTGLVHGVWANFQSETQNSNSAFGGDYVEGATVNAPGGVTGTGAHLTWTPGSHNVTNQDLYYADHTSNNNCTGVSYSSLQTAIGAAKSSIDGTGTTAPTDAVPSGDNGDNICYQIRSTNTSGWYTVANFAAVQVGLVPMAVSNDGASHTMTNGTHIYIDYNQNIAYSGAGTIEVCFASNSITFGDASTCTASFGTLSGGSSSTTPTCTSSGVAASNSRLTITLGGCPTTGQPSHRVPTTMSGTATFVPTGTVVKSSAGSFNQCTQTSAPPTGCQPQISY